MDAPAQPDPTLSSPPRPPRPRRPLVSLDGRAAPGLYAAGWLLTLFGLLVVALVVLGAVRGLPVALGQIVVEIAFLSIALGLIAGSGSQALQRRADAVPGYTGPSPFLVFTALIACTVALTGPIHFVESAMDIRGESVTTIFIALAVNLVLYAGLVGLLVVGTGALTWREVVRPLGIPSDTGSVIVANAPFAVPPPRGFPADQAYPYGPAYPSSSAAAPPAYPYGAYPYAPPYPYGGVYPYGSQPPPGFPPFPVASPEPTAQQRTAVDVLFGLGLALPLVMATGLVASILLELFGLHPGDVPSVLPPTHTTIERIAILIAAAVIAPLGEEIFFRGFSTNAWARRMSPAAAILRAGLFFAFVHVLDVGGADAGVALRAAAFAFASRIPVALVLCWVYLHRRSLYSSFALHAGYNGILEILSWAVATG